ncbi:MAG: SWIM zinc finger family protein [Cyanobacteria bacterium SBLK]|nr:SWIM zinc finger family protein [Cyanobacteria bacterium SBLK]
MEFNYSYNGSTAVSESGNGTQMSFSPDVKRQPTYFVGELRKNIAFREAISALHDVVVSDLRFKPKDRTEYKAWRSQQDDLDWQLIAAQRSQVRDRMEVLNGRLKELYQRRSNRWSAFYKAQREYYDYLYKRDYDMWFVLDPVITVHPDEVFFECFSQDESSYGRLGASYEVFQNIREFACGTTNIDYSATLYNEFQKIRSYKNTLFQVDPSGFEVQTTHEETYKEVKIDLPDSWVRGFLQVSSAMSLPATQFELQPMDVYNICFILRRYKEKQSPRGMRYHLTPGEPVKIVFEPWEKEIVCARSPYTGSTEQVIRVWGRRRLLILERLLPIAKKFHVHLLGTGMPSFYVADLGDMSFTLGLSGWSANDWSGSGNFDLMTSRTEVDALTQQQVFASLKENWAESVGDLAKRLHLDRSVVLGALSAYTQAGRAIYDLNKQVYRVRELSREPLPMERLRFANKREEKATRLLENDAVRVTSITGDLESDHTLQGTVRDGDRTYEPHLVIDSDRRLVQADCTCNWFQQNKLYKGPCEHMLALRMQCDRQRR